MHEVSASDGEYLYKARKHAGLTQVLRWVLAGNINCACLSSPTGGHLCTDPAVLHGLMYVLACKSIPSSPDTHEHASLCLKACPLMSKQAGLALAYAMLSPLQCPQAAPAVCKPHRWHRRYDAVINPFLPSYTDGPNRVANALAIYHHIAPVIPNFPLWLCYTITLAGVCSYSANSDVCSDVT